MNDLFDGQALTAKKIPLADRLRPTTLAEYIGQHHLLAQGKMLRQLIEADNLSSLIFWGPPGSGKTTLAVIIAQATKSNFINFSAVTAGLPALREALAKAHDNLKYQRQRTILFIDEIHRWNKSQQDALLPYVENGSICLIGATTENPSFEINSALLSRVKVFTLKELSIEHLTTILERALKHEKGLSNKKIRVEEGVFNFLASLANGDARVALNTLELASEAAIDGLISKELVKEALSKTHLRYDKDGEEHYNLISALHKSIRGGDINASLYWLARIVESGEDPLFVARRLVRAASEDIGLADPSALTLAVSVYTAAHYLGWPECNLALAEAVVYLTKAPKSNKLYKSYLTVKNDIENLPAYPVPLQLRNASTKLMKELGYGQDYKYPPDYKGEVKQAYLPPELKDKKYW